MAESIITMHPILSSPVPSLRSYSFLVSLDGWDGVSRLMFGVIAGYKVRHIFRRSALRLC